MIEGELAPFQILLPGIRVISVLVIWRVLQKRKMREAFVDRVPLKAEFEGAAGRFREKLLDAGHFHMIEKHDSAVGGAKIARSMVGVGGMNFGYNVFFQAIPGEMHFERSSRSLAGFDEYEVAAETNYRHLCFSAFCRDADNVASECRLIAP
jgi:hypothetical protein